MSKLSEFLTSIANAIRNLKGTTEPINAQNFANEINSMKEALDDTNATPEDIKEGKTAYVKGQKVEGTYKNPTSLKSLLEYSKSFSFYGNENIIDLTSYIAYEDTSNVTSMSFMFSGCINLTTIPLLDTSKVTSMFSMFNDCRKLTTIPLLDTSKVISMYSMFSGCINLTTIPLLDISNVLDMGYMFNDCRKLTNLTLLNIKRNLQVGSGSSWGYLLTLESLLGLCQECVNVNSSRTLTVGTTNKNKLSNIYVKLTGEPEEDETLPKIPMVQCESTDEGAMLIKDYMSLKNWNLA